MRLLRVRVDDVRGIESYEVAFARDGVTVIEAPNESGKSTLLDAVDLLLTEKDTSKKKAVRDLKPVGRDVGSRVEVELVCGEVHLTCVKRFNKQTETRLTVHAPEREQLTGAEAHDRLRQILESRVDLALFEALRFRQGRGLDGVALGESNVIAARLDEAAGGEGDTGDDDLLARVRAEYEVYFTPKGAEGKRLREVDDVAAAAHEHHDEVARRLEQLEDDVSELARLEREHRELSEEREGLVPELEHHRSQRLRVQRLRQQLAEADAAVERARREHGDVQREADTRGDLLRDLERAGQQRDDLDDRLAPVQQRLTGLEDRLTASTADVAAAHEALRGARAERQRAEDDAERLRLAEELARQRTRLERVDAVAAEAREAAAFLDACRLTDALLTEIRSAAEQARIAERLLEAGAPTVTLRPHAPIEAVIDGRPVALDPTSEERRHVEDRLRIDLPGVAEVEVAAGTSIERLRQDVADSRTALEEACRAGGVDGPGEAEHVAERRRAHERTLRHRDREIGQLLEGESREELAERVQLLGGRLAETGGAAVEAASVTGRAEAERTLERAREAERTAQAEADRAREARDALAEQVEARRHEVLADQARRDHLDTELERLGGVLTSAREAQPDERLEQRLDRAAEALRTAQRVARERGEELDALDPESVELLAANAERRAADLDERLADNARARSARRARLEVVGEEGLGERLAAARTHLLHAEREQRGTRARAAAAQALHDALRDARDEAYRAYQRPLRELIARHGRVVFGEGLQVELDEELKVVRRTLGGDTLDWEHLSSGAKEQLAILSALAAARLAADGGVPLVLDDTLGYTDPDRLAALGAVLGAADGAQVVVLTCVGERYRHVGGARTVRLVDARPEPLPAGS